MSIQSEIHRLDKNVADAFAAIDSKGGTLPEKAVSANLAAAVDSIPDFVPVQRVEGSFTVAYDSNWVSPTGEVVSYVALKYTP